jgi:hypothetical protein
MNEPERLTGDQAQEVIRSLREKEVVIAGEGGEAIFGENDDGFYLCYPGFAFELPDEDEDLSPSVLRFVDRESRNAHMRDTSPMEAYRARGWLVTPPGFPDSSALGIGGYLLAGCADWLRELTNNSTNCADLQESDLKKALLGRLRETLSVESEVDVRGTEDQDGRIPEWNPGWVDLIAESDDGDAWIELKWAKDYSTLSNCLWDAAKLAGAVRAKAAAAGYLVAGAPAGEWEGSHPYGGLFTFQEWAGSSLVDAHPTSWRRWRRENIDTFPRQIVDPVQILPMGYVRGGPDDWEIRIARVTAPGSKMTPMTELGFEF